MVVRALWLGEGDDILVRDMFSIYWEYPKAPAATIAPPTAAEMNLLLLTLGKKHLAENYNAI